MKDPRTGRRLARPNPPHLWETIPVPELRIVTDELWLKAKQRQREVRSRGGGQQKGACDNGRTITRQEIESRVLAGLKERLLAPDLVAAFMTALQGELTRERTRRLASAGQRAKELAEIDRRIAGMLRAIEDGLYEPSMKDRMAALRAEREAHLAAGEPEPDAQFDILLHPRLPELYRRKVETLEAVLDGPDRAEAMDVIRSMIDQVELRPRADGPGLAAVLHGDLAAILAACGEAKAQNAELPGAGERPGRLLSVVADHRELSLACAV